MEFEQVKKKAQEAKTVEEFFGVFKELADNMGLDLGDYSERLAKRFGEKKTLSDKIRVVNSDGSEGLFPREIKQALKEFIDWMNLTRKGNNPDEYLPKAKEIFGEKLLS